MSVAFSAAVQPKPARYHDASASADPPVIARTTAMAARNAARTVVFRTFACRFRLLSWRQRATFSATPTTVYSNTMRFALNPVSPQLSRRVSITLTRLASGRRIKGYGPAETSSP
jgi:hypothetical protein